MWITSTRYSTCEMYHQSQGMRLGNHDLVPNDEKLLELAIERENSWLDGPSSPRCRKNSQDKNIFQVNQINKRLPNLNCNVSHEPLGSYQVGDSCPNISGLGLLGVRTPHSLRGSRMTVCLSPVKESDIEQE